MDSLREGWLSSLDTVGRKTAHSIAIVFCDRGCSTADSPSGIYEPPNARGRRQRRWRVHASGPLQRL